MGLRRQLGHDECVHPWVHLRQRAYDPNGPGLNAPNRYRLGWIGASKVYTFDPKVSLAANVTLAALERQDLSAPLMIKVPINGDPNHYYSIEYRKKRGWDRGIPPRPGVGSRGSSRGWLRAANVPRGQQRRLAEPHPGLQGRSEQRRCRRGRKPDRRDDDRVTPDVAGALVRKRCPAIDWEMAEDRGSRPMRSPMALLTSRTTVSAGRARCIHDMAAALRADLQRTGVLHRGHRRPLGFSGRTRETSWLRPGAQGMATSSSMTTRAGRSDSWRGPNRST